MRFLALSFLERKLKLEFQEVQEVNTCAHVCAFFFRFNLGHPDCAYTQITYNTSEDGTQTETTWSLPERCFSLNSFDTVTVLGTSPAQPEVGE